MRRKEKPSSTVGKSFVTGIEAVQLFRSKMPNDWLYREQSPDFFIDFMIEEVKAGEPCGQHFGAQVKGVGKTSQKNPQYRFEPKHLKYYSQCKHPVFLFLVDVPRRNIRWVFAQEYIHQKFAIATLEGTRKIAVSFHDDNELADINQFIEALVKARKFMAERNPGSIEAAISHEKNVLESIDPRVSVSIDVIAGMKHVTVTPNIPINFSMTISSADPELTAQITDFIESGSVASIPSENIQTIGMPLMEHFHAQANEPIKMQFVRQRPIDLEVVLDEHRSIRISGMSSFGTKFMIVETLWPGSPLEIDLKIDYTSMASSTIQGCGGLQFNPKIWIGEYIVYLKHFDDIHAILSSVKRNGGTVDVRLKSNGNTLLGTKIPFGDDQTLVSAWHLIEVLFQCRKIARHFNLNLKLPPFESISSQDLKSISILYALVDKGEYSEPAPFARWAISGPVNYFKIPPESMKGDLKGGPDEESFILFGHTIKVEPMHFTLTRATFETVEKIDAESERVILTGDKDSISRREYLGKPIRSLP